MTTNTFWRAFAVSLAISLPTLSAGATQAWASTLTYGDVVAAQYTGPCNGAANVHRPAPSNTDANVDVGPCGIILDGVAFQGLGFNAAADVAPPWDWTGIVMTAQDVADYYFGDTAVGDQQTAMIAWLNTQWVGQPAGRAQAVNLAMWEVTADFNGMAGSLNANPANGDFYVNSAQYTSATEVNLLLSDAYVRLNDSLASVGGTYVIAVSQVSDQMFAGATQYRDSNLWFTLQMSTQPFALPSTSVPEPGTLSLALLGMVTLLYRGRRPLRD